MVRTLLHTFISLALVVSTLPSAAFAHVALSEQAPVETTQGDDELHCSDRNVTQANRSVAASLPASDCCLSDCSCATANCAQSVCDTRLTAESIIGGELIAHTQDEHVDGIVRRLLGHPPKS